MVCFVVLSVPLVRNLNRFPYLVYINNHTAVWGSWYDTSTGNWGYACCHSSIHISYCSGLVGIEAAEASSAQQLLASSSTQPSQQKVDTEDGAERVERVDQNYSKKRIGEGDVKLDQELLAQSVLDEKKRKSGGMNGDERSSKKQKSGQGGSHEVTEEELGAFLHLFFCKLHLTYRCRGIPDEPTDDRRSHGQLR